MKDIKQIIEESLNLNEAKRNEWIEDEEWVWSKDSKYILIDSYHGFESRYFFFTDETLEEFYDGYDDIIKNAKSLKPGKYMMTGYGDGNIIIRFK